MSRSPGHVHGLARLVQVPQQGQEFIVRRDIPLFGSVMGEPDHSVSANHDDPRKPAELEESELLTERLQHPTARVRDAGKRQLMLLPESPECPVRPGTNRDHFGVVRPECLVVLPQLRQMPPAMRSPEAPQKCQNQRLPARVITDAILCAIKRDQS